MVRIWIVRTEIGPGYQKNGGEWIVRTGFIFPDAEREASIMLEPMEEKVSVEFSHRLDKMQGEEIIVSGKFEEIEYPYVVLTDCILVEAP